MATRCKFPVFSFAFVIPFPIPSLPRLDLDFALAIPFPLVCPLD